MKTGISEQSVQKYIVLIRYIICIISVRYLDRSALSEYSEFKIEAGNPLSCWKNSGSQGLFRKFVKVSAMCNNQVWKNFYYGNYEGLFSVFTGYFSVRKI